MFTKIEMSPYSLKAEVVEAIAKVIPDTPIWGVCFPTRIAFTFARVLTPKEQGRLRDLLDTFVKEKWVIDISSGE